MNEVYIIDALRTPIGKYGGLLSTVRPDDLLAHVIKSLLERNKAIEAQTQRVLLRRLADHRAKRTMQMKGRPPCARRKPVERLAVSRATTDLADNIQQVAIRRHRSTE